MAQSVLLIFILITALFYTANSLTCYQCIPETSNKCAETKVECPANQCGTMKTTSYTGNNKLADIIMKNCSVTDQCVTATVNFGITRIIINNQCCNTNLCNNQSEPEPPKMIPNGIHCYTCNGENCSPTLPCVDGEDHCIKATVNTEGQSMTMRGCATQSFCRGDLSTQISQSKAEAVDLSCCRGHLCNAAPPLRSLRSLPLGLLIYVIINTTD